MFTNTQNWSSHCRPKVVSILATLFGAGSTIWSTLYAACVVGSSAAPQRLRSALRRRPLRLSHPPTQGGSVRRSSATDAHRPAAARAAGLATELPPGGAVIGWNAGLSLGPPPLHAYDGPLEGSYTSPPRADGSAGGGASQRSTTALAAGSTAM